MTARTVAPDNDQRELAAGELDKNLVVLAGAGTGKTTLLIDRLTLLIVGQEIPVEKIVALTFTKKAAEEMRSRLELRLGEIIKGEDSFELLERRFPSNKSKWAALAQKALEDIPKSQIGTIHSFAGHLLRLYPLQAGVDPKFREDQGMVGENTFERLWAEWIAAELSDQGGQTTAWTSLLQRVTLSELRHLAWALVSPMVKLDSLRKKTDLTPLFAQVSQRLDDLRRRYPHPAKARSFLPGLDALAAIFEALRKGQLVSPSLLDLIDCLDKPPADWIEAKSALTDLKKTAKAFAVVDEKIFLEIFDRLMPFVKTVRRELARVGAVSFEGLLVFARDLLRDHADVRAALKKRFAAFLIDEFQDTDPLQGEILFYLAERLSSAASAWQDVQLAPGRLFVVGDPKQSIYRFRGADIAAFEAFEDHMVRQGALRATLSANFRSDPRILDFVNAIFPAAMKEEKYLQPAYVPLQPGKEDSPSQAPDAVRIVTTMGEEGAKLGARARRILEARTIADWIEAQGKAGLPYSKVALLLRSANAFEDYLEVFRSRGIPYLAEGEKSFYRTSEVLDFLNLLAVVADPEDKLALAGVLRSPVGGLNDKEIWELSQAGGLSILSAPRVHREKIGRLFQTLRALSEDARAMPLGKTIRIVFARTWALETASLSSHGEQSVANLLKMGRLAEVWSEQEPMTLKDFVRRFDRYRDDERDEGENPLADVKYDAVKVLTIHKAKGLEFPVVILPNLSAGARAGGMDKRILRRDWRTGLVGLRLEDRQSTNAAMAEIERQEDRREQAEEVRVFYVAATRAKEQLVCFVSGNEKARGRFAEIIKAAGPLPNVANEEIQQNPWVEPAVPKPALALGGDWNVEALASRFKKREAEAEAIKGRRLLISPTSLLVEPEKKRLVDDEEAQLSRETAILIGHMCHKVMEEWDFKSAPAKHKSLLGKAVERAAKLFELADTDPASKSVKEEALQILSGFFKSEVYKNLCKTTIISRELPFLNDLTGGVAMRGVIDLLYEWDGRLVVADYKTNRLEDGSPAKLVEHYRAQGAAYQNAVRRALSRDVGFELIFLRESLSVKL